MCGIVGVVHKASNGFDKKNEDTFYQMLMCDTLRGDDSTGVILVENTTAFGIMKEGYSAPYVIDTIHDSKQGRAMFQRGKAMIGHNRKKTVGAVEDATSHPFVVGDTFAMVHNGTLHNHKDLDHKDEAETVVDSEALAIHIEPALNGEWDLEKWEECIGKVRGAFAVAAYSQNNNAVYLFRNDQRPLSFVDTPEGLYWASEMGMLYWILGRNGVTLKGHEPVVVKENALYRIDLDTNKVEVISYVPKKATPVAALAATGTKGNGKRTKNQAGTSVTTHSAGSSLKRLSKNAFKQVKRRWMEKVVDFWADDYIEKEYPKTIAQGAADILLMGDIDEFGFDHWVSAEFDLNDLSPKDKFLNCLFQGTICEMAYDKVSGIVTVSLNNVKKVKYSKAPANETQPTVH